MAIAFDGLQKVPREQMPPMESLMDWLGQVSFMESKYVEYRDSLTEFTKLLKDNSIKVLILKGYGLSLNYSQAKHRLLGDFDIFPLNGEYEQVNALMEAKGIEVDRSHHKHSVFSFKSLTVENHHSFLNAHAHRSTAEIEEMLETIVTNVDYKTSEIENVYYPSVRFNALYLLRHSGAHFASVDMSVRVVLDWATFISSMDGKERSECWEWLLPVLDKVGMKEYLAVLNAICVRYMGYDASLFPDLPVDERLVERSMMDILQPESAQVAGSSHSEKRNLPRELTYCFRRWKANGWKHNMVYRESCGSRSLLNSGAMC